MGGERRVQCDVVAYANEGDDEGKAEVEHNFQPQPAGSQVSCFSKVVVSPCRYLFCFLSVKAKLHYSKLSLVHSTHSNIVVQEANGNVEEQQAGGKVFCRGKHQHFQPTPQNPPIPPRQPAHLPDDAVALPRPADWRANILHHLLPQPHVR